MIAGVPVAWVATAASPLRAILAAVQPFGNAFRGWPAGETAFVVFAAIATAALNAYAIWRLRVWNPGRDILPVQHEEGQTHGIWSADHDVRQLEARAEVRTAGDAAAAAAESARAGHVDHAAMT